MTADKQSGAYKITSVTFTPGPTNSVLAQVNFEGTAPGYGTVLGTNTFVVGKRIFTKKGTGKIILDTYDCLGYGRGMLFTDAYEEERAWPGFHA